MEGTSLMPCNETGWSLIRDKRMETCSIAISSLSLDLADSINILFDVSIFVV
jgi:hypothetical protein